MTKFSKAQQKEGHKRQYILCAAPGLESDVHSERTSFSTHRRKNNLGDRSTL